MKKLLQSALAFLAKRILNKYQPKIVGITGSIGKTSAKEAIFSVLKSKFNVRTNIKNYNNELGLPLTIINVEAGGQSLWKWLKVFGAALKLIFVKDKDYPDVLVLEMGADHPGDIEYLTSIAPCFCGVVTKVAPVHLEFFKTLEKIAKEKGRIVGHLKKDGFAILNFDDELVKQMTKITKAQVISFGYAADAQVRAIELQSQGQGLKLTGLQFKLQFKGSTVPVFLPGVIGAHQIYAAMAAAAVGIAFGMNLIEVSLGLKNYHSPKGRMNLIAGKKNSLIIDDTYNSSPEAAKAAIETVGKIAVENGNRKIAIMGDMLELGEISEQAHLDLGKQVAANGFTVGIFVGGFREQMAKGASEAGLKTVMTFEDSKKAAATLPDIIQDKDVILIKGSQGARMERVVKVLMAEPDKAADLIVRQTEDWK
jgi:UDP-N-acetylmuramoyl-tripeptide--D-alanyl-D-alanine ligase